MDLTPRQIANADQQMALAMDTVASLVASAQEAKAAGFTGHDMFREVGLRCADAATDVGSATGLLAAAVLCLAGMIEEG